MLNLVNSILLIFGDAKKSLVLGLIIGLAIGWFVVGWGLWPVTWTDAAPVDLSAKYQYKQQYVRLMAEDYANNADVDLEALLGQRWSAEDAAKLAEEMAKQPGRGDQAQLLDLAMALRNLPPPETPKSTSLLSLPVCLAGLFVLLVVAVGGVIVWRRIMGPGIPKSQPGVITPVDRARASQPVAPTTWTGMAEKPVSQFVTTYELGDNRYDMSFSVESGADFLGECGVAISESIGAGDPDKVTALEVWLFDKNDIRTVTKVMMSDYCFNDTTLRAKLAPKGEATLIGPDASVELDTQTLKLRARVIELEYGSGGLPPSSFFKKVTLELAAWPKA